MYLNKFNSKYFNLIKKEKIYKNYTDYIYEWVSIRARLVVILLEIITVILFLFKAIEDTNAKNLNTKINNNQSMLSFYSENIEFKIREIQTKAQNYVELWNNSVETSKILEEIYNLSSNNLKDNIKIQIVDSNVYISSSENVNLLKILENSLKKDSIYLSKSTVRVNELISQNTSNEAEDVAQISIFAKISERAMREKIL